MKLTRFAQILELKYKLSADPSFLEGTLRKDIDALYVIPNKTNNIIKACADSHPSKPVTGRDHIAVAGYRFCQNVLSKIDYLKQNAPTISMGELREVLLLLANSIVENKDISFNEDGKPNKINKDEEKALSKDQSKQFPHVTELIFIIMPHSTAHDRTKRSEQYSLARTGFSKILSKCISMLKDLETLEAMAPDKFKYTNVTDVDIDEKLPERFSPQRAELSQSEIISFIRRYGDQYGISSTEDWEKAFLDDIMLKEQITTVINALNRGHSPRDEADAKLQIARALRDYERRKSSDGPHFTNF